MLAHMIGVAAMMRKSILSVVEAMLSLAKGQLLARIHKPKAQHLYVGRIAIATAILTASMMAEASAQSANRDARIDFQRRRSDILTTPSTILGATGTVASKRAQAIQMLAPAADEPEKPAPEFSFNVIAPFFFNSNANGAPQGQSESSGEGDPELKLTWGRQLKSAPIALSAILDTDMDRYTHFSDADGDKAYAALKSSFTDGSDDQDFIPFISYSATLTFKPTYQHLNATTHDINIGFDKTSNFDGNWNQQPSGSDTSAGTAWSVGLTSKLQRRETDGGASSTALYLQPSLSHTWSKHWNTTVEVDVVARGFDRSKDFSRRDLTINPFLDIQFIFPASWFGNEETDGGDGQKQSVFGTPKLDFLVSYLRVFSNKEDARIEVWSVGPILSTSWKF